MAADLRTDGFYTETDLMNRSLKAQLKYANKIGARYTMVIGDSELEAGKARLKDMDSGEEQEVAFDRLADVADGKGSQPSVRRDRRCPVRPGGALRRPGSGIKFA